MPEMFVRARVTEGVNEQAILVPQQGVLRNPKGEPYVMVVEGEGKVGMRMLTLEREVGDQWLIGSGLAVDDRVAIEPPAAIQRLLAERGYLPAGVPLLKRVAAVPGQRVCRTGLAITVDGVPMGDALDRDRRGRPLPVW